MDLSRHRNPEGSADLGNDTPAPPAAISKPDLTIAPGNGVMPQEHPRESPIVASPDRGRWPLDVFGKSTESKTPDNTAPSHRGREEGPDLPAASAGVLDSRRDPVDTPTEDSDKIGGGLSAGLGVDMDRDYERETDDFRSSAWSDNWEDEAYPDRDGVTPGDADDPADDIDDAALHPEPGESPSCGSDEDELKSLTAGLGPLEGPAGANDEGAEDGATTVEREPVSEEPSANGEGVPERGNDAEEPTADRSESLVDTALRIGSPAERESLARNLAGFGNLHPRQVEKLDTRKWDGLDDDVKAAAREIWTEAAGVVARAVTELNQRREFLDALQNWTDPAREASAEVRNKQQQFWTAMRKLAQDLVDDVVIELAKEVLIEMLFPGAHLVIPPTGLVDAIFTACTLLKIAEEAH